tara:strand:+ start:80 stop:373 length:294 start_codon:yes stop_codon:yes gene_type:complete
MTDIAEVIGWKHNHQSGMCTSDGVITEFPGGIPSAEDQALWVEQYSAYLASTAYIAKRKADYKSLEEQADMRYWDSVNGTTLLNDHIAKVKSDNPKG